MKEANHFFFNAYMSCPWRRLWNMLGVFTIFKTLEKIVVLTTYLLSYLERYINRKLKGCSSQFKLDFPLSNGMEIDVICLAAEDQI